MVPGVRNQVCATPSEPIVPVPWNSGDRLAMDTIRSLLLSTTSSATLPSGSGPPIAGTTKDCAPTGRTLVVVAGIEVLAGIVVGKEKGRQLSPEEKWKVFLEVTSQELTQADAARKWQVDVSTVIKIRRLAKDAALAAFAAFKPGRPRSPLELELEAAQAENARLGEALKELAVELTVVRGKAR